MANEGKSVSELLEYARDNPDAFRGANAGRLQDIIDRQVGAVSRLSGEDQFDAYVRLGIIEKDSQYVKPEKGSGSWAYIPKSELDKVTTEKTRLTTDNDRIQSDSKWLQSSTIIGSSPSTGELLLKGVDGQQRWIKSNVDTAKAYAEAINIQENGETLAQAISRGVSPDLLKIVYSASDVDIAVKDSSDIKKYADWTPEELVGGKVTKDGTYIPSPWGYKGGDKFVALPIWAKDKVAQAQLQAVNSLQSYLTPDKKGFDVTAAVKAGKEAELRLLGATVNDIDQSKKNIETRMNTPPTPAGATTKTGVYAKPTNVEPLTPDSSGNRALAGTIGGVALDMLPVVGSVREYQRASADGKWTPAEVGWFAASVGADVLTLSLVGAGAGMAARGAVGLGRWARVAAATRALGTATLAEITAPVEMIRHPVRTVKDIAKLGETLVRPSKIPLAATEVSTATVRLPVKAFRSPEEAMKVRDVGTLAAIREGKFSSQVGDVTLDLSPATIQRVGNPVAIHATPDYRPFLEGLTIQAGREGGLFVAPNLHTRFTMASAFGDMPKSTQTGTRGAVIIRDQAILDKLGGSGKVYNGTVEVEALLKAGLDLPKPSQILFTRAPAADVTELLKEASILRQEGKIEDALALERKAKALKTQGDKIALLIIGKPFTAKEISELKIAGALDNIKDIITPPAKLSGKGINAYDELNDVRRGASGAILEAQKLRKAGKIEDAIAAEKRADELLSRASRMANRIGSPTSGIGGSLRVALISTNDRTPLTRLSSAQGTRSSTVDLSDRQLRTVSEIYNNRQLGRRAERVAGVISRDIAQRETRGETELRSLGRADTERIENLLTGDRDRETITGSTTRVITPAREIVRTPPEISTIRTPTGTERTTVPPRTDITPIRVIPPPVRSVPPPDRIVTPPGRGGRTTPPGTPKSRAVTASPTGVLVPAGSIVWKQGELSSGKNRVNRPVWKYIPPEDFGKDVEARTLMYAPHGVKVLEGSPAETLQIIEGSRKGIPKRVNVNVGWADVTVVNGKDIEFVSTESRKPKSEGAKKNISAKYATLASDITDADLSPDATEGYNVVNRAKMSKKAPPRKGNRKISDWDYTTTLKGFRF
jgi:hypothetical protein